MRDDKDIIEICLFGQFSIISGDGSEVTPRGRKGSALIALLAECETMKRSRKWIEETLWSDRATDQARGSLRQTLFETRREFGPLSDILQSDRTSVWLDRQRVRLSVAVAGRTFLEGLDVRDPAFTNWIMRKRLAYERRDDAAPSCSVRTVTIQCGLPWTSNESDPLGAQIVNDRIGSIISGFIANSKCGVLDTDVDIIVRATLEEMSEGAVIAVQVVDARRDVLIHSDHCVAGKLTSILADKTELGRFCWTVADHALDRLAESRREENAAAMRAAFSQEAVRAVLSFDPSEMPNSLKILEAASRDLEDGLFHALKAWSMMSLIMEDRLEESRDTLAAINVELEKARQLAPGDAMVNGVSANVRAVLFEDYSEAVSMSTAALRAQPNNVFATQAMTLCRFNAGAHDAAYRMSRNNRIVAEATKYGAMCNLHHALLCLRTNRADEALATSRAAVDAVPNYRAPSRQLVALYAANGQIEEASATVAALSAVEPEFSIERLFNDPEYPANTLRETGVLNRARTILGDS